MNIRKLFRSKPRCRHIHPDGKPCKATPQKGRDVCYFHDPDRAQERLEARRRGSVACNSEPRFIPPGFDPGPLETLEQIGDFIDRIGLHVSLGEMDLRSARRYLDKANTLIRRIRKIKKEERRQYRAQRAKNRELKRKVSESKLWVFPAPKTKFYIN